MEKNKPIKLQKIMIMPIVNKSNLVKCTVCKNDHHKMRIQYAYCNNVNCNEKELCPRRTKILTCKKNETENLVRMYTANKHNSNHFKLKQHGISPSVKELIEDIINNYDNRPKRVHIKLQSIKSRVDRMPSLKQVQDFIKNRRKRIGDDNNVEHLNEAI